MCGIVGFIDFNKKLKQDTLTNMTKVIAHRGPDDSGEYFFKSDFANIGLGHRRLSILDLSREGHQPFHFRNLSIVYNGEVYNFKEIREELLKEGFEFKSNSDTEVIIKSFYHWGIKAVDKFVGMFAFAIFDKDSNKIYLFRDRAGVKPFYYYYKNGVFLFGSELKSFHECREFSKEIDISTLAQYLQHGYILEPYSIFRDTYKLSSGNYLEIDLKTKEIKKEKYWSVYDFYAKPKLDLSEDEIIEHTHNLLKKSFSYRMVSDVPVGVFLSGGYDSSIVTAILQSQSRDKLKTFTIGFHEKGFDEAPYAKEVANYLGTNHTQYYCTSKEASDIIPTLVDIYDEPFADSSAIPTILVSQLAKKDVSVVLSADGGDEVFVGYNKYDMLLKFYYKYKKYPYILRYLLSKGINISSSLFPYQIQRKILKRTALIGNRDVREFFENMSKHYNDRELKKLFIDKIEIRNNFGEDVSKIRDDLDKVLAIDYSTYMRDDILTKVDRATMSVSLEGREPLLDNSIIEFIAQVDSKIKYKNGIKKYILKEITHQYIPKELMDRPKKGFGIPIFEWFKDDLKEYIDYYLSPERLREEGIFNADIVSDRVKLYFEGKLKDINEIWYILVFEMWYERWIRGVKR
jgi:asparagine synthase (glutamine-hydrolysing)